MSRASADVRLVTLNAPELQVDVWSVWTTIEEWRHAFNETQDAFFTYLQWGATAFILLCLLLCTGRWLLRRSRIRHYSRGK